MIYRVLRMLSILDLINQTQFLQGFPIAFLITGFLFSIVAFNAHRLSLIVLPLLYTAAAILFSNSLEPRYMVVKFMTGLFVCLILTLTFRQLTFRQLSGVNGRVRAGTALASPREPLQRIGIALIVAILLTILATNPRFLLPGLPETAVAINLTIFQFTGLGILGILFADSPFHNGVGLLLFLIGFELFYAYFNQTPMTLMILAAINFCLALVISYLTQSVNRPQVAQ